MSRTELKKIDIEHENDPAQAIGHSGTANFDNQNPNLASKSVHEDLEMNSVYTRNNENPKIPESITSMPQISVHQAPNFSN